MTYIYVEIDDWKNERKTIKKNIEYFEANKHILSIKRGFYIYGENGIGKSTFVRKILEEMDYQIISFDSCDYKIQTIVDSINNNTIGDTCVLSMFKKRKKKIILLDDLSIMLEKEKNSITTLVKIMRSKKTKRQKTEVISNVPIICINNDNTDKKIKELMHVCCIIHLKTPKQSSFMKIILEQEYRLNQMQKDHIQKYCDSNLRMMFSLYKNMSNMNTYDFVPEKYEYFNNAKKIVKHIINHPYRLNQHSDLLNDTDRTSVSMLYHENIIDHMNTLTDYEALDIYSLLLKNMCFADYIDRITFQKQIWTLNELSSIIKNISNPNEFYEFCNSKNKTIESNSREIRFTKVLTKYSTEYNNNTFLSNFCQKLRMDTKDVICTFIDLSKQPNIDYSQYELYDITPLDINRMLKFVKHFTTN